MFFTIFVGKYLGLNTLNYTFMKKILLVAALVLGFAAAATAQPRAVGIRGGYGIELSYQHNLGYNFIEADLGLAGSDFNIAATYNWSLLQFGDGFNVYAGPGAALGFGSGFFNIGVAGQVGLEYTFSFPLQLSLDIRPQLGITSIKNYGASFHSWGWYPCLGIRYAF